MQSCIWSSEQGSWHLICIVRGLIRHSVPPGQSAFDMHGPQSPPGADSHMCAELQTPLVHSVSSRQPTSHIPLKVLHHWPMGHWVSMVHIVLFTGTHVAVA